MPGGEMTLRTHLDLTMTLWSLRSGLLLDCSGLGQTCRLGGAIYKVVDCIVPNMDIHHRFTCGWLDTTGLFNTTMGITQIFQMKHIIFLILC